MSWQAPSKAYPFLSLAKLQLQKPFQSPIENSASAVRIPVGDNFIQLWTQGPISEQVEDVHQALRTLATAFCELIRLGSQHVQVKEKKSPSDLVTEMDTGIEMLFRIWMQTFLPNHKIIGEEGVKEEILSEDTVWYIDPVDGTTNFVEGRDQVTLHISANQAGKPWVSVVGMPFENRVVSGYLGCSSLEGDDRSASEDLAALVLGTEYRETSMKEARLYSNLLTTLNADPYRVKSIGCNLMALLRSEVSLFYKPMVRYWDIMAPLALIYFSRSDEVTMRLYISGSEAHLCVENKHSLSPFSHAPILLETLNRQHKTSGKIGLIIVTPINNEAQVDAVLNAYMRQA